MNIDFAYVAQHGLCFMIATARAILMLTTWRKLFLTGCTNLYHTYILSGSIASPS